MTTSVSAAPKAFTWRTPAVLVLCGCCISVLTFGPRSSMGFFLTPLSQANGWGRDVFALALAVQNLLWGIGQPFAGAISDKFGAPRVLSAGVLLNLSDVDCDDAGAALHLRGRADRVWPVGVRGPDGDRGPRQAVAGKLALGRVRCGDGGWLVWPIPVLAARC